ncbi:aerotaxis sensor receptor, flavoprotein (fragment) [uncultured Thiomicrorhabdus sp.]
MKDNGPVTQKEHLLPPDTKIVSFTDLHGTITHANEAFIDASGYEWSELIGQAHNILRHPDVPAVVFKDFWETIQAGKPWSQIVKNRCKNGDHYWVRANATPIFENGKVVSYMSFRRQ